MDGGIDLGETDFALPAFGNLAPLQQDLLTALGRRDFFRNREGWTDGSGAPTVRLPTAKALVTRGLARSALGILAITRRGRAVLAAAAS